ncbi:hypothetical protein ACFLVC_00780 [Chloroflexota bacterium]
MKESLIWGVGPPDKLITNENLSVITSSVVFILAALFSPKRKVKGWQEKPVPVV